MKEIYIAALTIFLFSTSVCLGGDNLILTNNTPELTSYSQIINNSVEYDTEKKYNLSMIRVRFMGTIGFEIPWIAGFALKPSIEFIWK